MRWSIYIPPGIFTRSAGWLTMIDEVPLWTPRGNFYEIPPVTRLQRVLGSCKHVITKFLRHRNFIWSFKINIPRIDYSYKIKIAASIARKEFYIMFGNISFLDEERTALDEARIASETVIRYVDTVFSINSCLTFGRSFSIVATRLFVVNIVPEMAVRLTQPIRLIHVESREIRCTCGLYY